VRVTNRQVVFSAILVDVVHGDVALERHGRVCLAVGKVQVEEAAVLNHKMEREVGGLILQGKNVGRESVQPRAIEAGHVG
jgi:hypothetical protein